MNLAAGVLSVCGGRDRLVFRPGTMRNHTDVKASEHLTAQVGAMLSIILALWGLAFAVTPLGAIGGAVAALFGLAFGMIALLSHACGRWRLTALTGIGISTLALLLFALFIVFLG